MKTRWRAPVAVTASVLVALVVYRIADRAQHPQTATPVPRLVALAPDSLVALHDLLNAVVPMDEILPASNADADALLAALAWSGVMNMSPRSEPPEAGDLSDAALDGISGLVGGPG